jgi:hypothetical protein
VLDGVGREISSHEGSRVEIESWLAREFPHASARFVGVPNPAKGPWKETQDVTDRALRYRANANAPPGERRCCLCGSTQNVEVGHVNGHEEDSSPANLFWTCRSCNVRCGNTLRRFGLGRLTHQYNPPSEGAPNLGAWVNAVLSLKGDPGGNMPVSEAVAMVRATSPAQRSRFANDIWARRRRHGNNRPSVPF